MSNDSFEDYALYQSVYKLTLSLYAASAKLPKNEIDGITTNLRKAAINIPANIAKAYEIQFVEDKHRFYELAKSSLLEVAYFLNLINDLSLGDFSELLMKTREITELIDIQIKSIIIEIKKN